MLQPFFVLLCGTGVVAAQPGLFASVAGACVAFAGPLDYGGSMYEFTSALGRKEDGRCLPAIPAKPGPLAPGAIQAEATRGFKPSPAVTGGGDRAWRGRPRPRQPHLCRRGGTRAPGKAMRVQLPWAPVPFLFAEGGAQSNGPTVSNPSCCPPTRRPTPMTTSPAPEGTRPARRSSSAPRSPDRLPLRPQTARNAMRRWAPWRSACCAT